MDNHFFFAIHIQLIPLTLIELMSLLMQTTIDTLFAYASHMSQKQCEAYLSINIAKV